MKVTRLGRTRPLLSLTGVLGGSGSPGQVPGANGSNSVGWVDVIQSVTVNGTDTVLGPHIDFANGSNTVVSRASNTIYVNVTGVDTDPADDTHVWMPLTSVMDGEPVLVWDDDDSLIPTLVPLE